MGTLRTLKPKKMHVYRNPLNVDTCKCCIYIFFIKVLINQELTCGEIFLNAQTQFKSFRSKIWNIIGVEDYYY